GAFFAGRASSAPGPQSAPIASAPSVPAAVYSSAVASLAPPPAAPRDPMAQGLEALYVKRDPALAATRFREVLAQNPGHYGATYQLATALYQAGDLAASRPVWQRMLAMAEATQDAATAEAARARLAEIEKAMPSDPDAEDMRLGMQSLYEK